MATNTRSSNLPDFEHYDPSHHAGNELKSFKTWLRRFENRYEIVTDIAATANAQAKDADKKRWLLNFVSDGVLDNFETLYDTVALFKEATYDDLIKKYCDQLNPI